MVWWFNLDTLILLTYWTGSLKMSEIILQDHEFWKQNNCEIVYQIYVPLTLHIHFFSALKKKVYEYEHQQDILKRKSDCFEQLINKKPKLEDSSSRRKSNPVCKFQSNSIENLYAASPSNSRTSMCSPGPSASQESLTNVCSPGPSASPESLIEQSQSSLVEQTQSSDESWEDLIRLLYLVICIAPECEA